MENRKQRILTGDRTTGKLHLGHYVGSLSSRVSMQYEYETFILLADIQALTTHFEQKELLHQSIREVTIDNLSVGLNPEIATIVQQSAVPSIAEMTVFYSMITSVNVLRHNPTIKTEAKQYGYKDLSYGFLGYPVSQAADITFCNADVVPVGEDQIPHIELTRRIVRKFNGMYGTSITEPEAKLSQVSRLSGLDGNAKMGKSLGNAIYLSDTPKDVAEKVRRAVTDPARVTKDIPGDPSICNVAKYHKIFTPDEYDSICSMCRSATIGCVACKKKLTESLNTLLEPFREKRAYYEERPELVRDIIQTGTARANELGNETVKMMKDAMHLSI